ncbi:unnamed protein product, partial [Discosporangium mesarthrocarpum]
MRSFAVVALAVALINSSAQSRIAFLSSFSVPASSQGRAFRNAGCQVRPLDCRTPSASRRWRDVKLRMTGLEDECKTCREQALREAEGQEKRLTAQERAARALGKEISPSEVAKSAREIFEEANQKQRRRNMKIAAASFLSSVSLF